VARSGSISLAGLMVTQGWQRLAGGQGVIKRYHLSFLKIQVVMRGFASLPRGSEAGTSLK